MRDYQDFKQQHLPYYLLASKPKRLSRCRR